MTKVVPTVVFDDNFNSVVTFEADFMCIYLNFSGQKQRWIIAH